MPAKPRKLPAKPRADVTRHVELRLAETDLALVREAAALSGFPVATWVRAVAIEAARARIKAA